MALTAVDFVDSDLSTVLFACMSATGSENSGFGSVPTKFAVRGTVKLDGRLEATRFEHSNLDGAFTTKSRRSLGTATWRQVVSASSEANLRLGIGRLADLVTRGGILRVTAGSTRYLRYEPSMYPQPFQGDEEELRELYSDFNLTRGLEIVLDCQPYWEGAEVTTSTVGVPNNPASGTSGVRVFAVSGVTGDLPTPARVSAKVAAVSITLQTSAAADDIIDATNHGFTVNDAVVFTSLTGGSGLTVGTVYFVSLTSFGTNTFRVSTSPGATAIGFTTDITAGAVQLAGTVESVLIGQRARNTRASTFFSDFLSQTGYIPLGEGSPQRGWTITLGTSAANQADTEASGGNCVFFTPAAPTTLMQRRVRAERTTLMDSLRGEWDVYLRVRHDATGTDDVPTYFVLAWAPSVADPATITEEPVPFTFGTGATGLNYSDLKLGSIAIPEHPSVSVSGLALEVWAAFSSTTDTASGFGMDFLWFVPKNHQGRVIVPGGVKTSTLGKNLLTPVSNPAGGTAGTVPSGSTSLKLDTTTDNAGVGGTGGVVYAAGRYRVTWKFKIQGLASGATATIKPTIRNVTGSTNVYQVTVGYRNGTKQFTTDFYADGTTAYQVQVDDPSVANVYYIQSIDVEALPALARQESVRTDPMRFSVDKLDSSGALNSYLGNEGELMATLDPGDNHLFIVPDEVPAIGNNVRENKLERIMDVTVSYFPRFSF